MQKQWTFEPRIIAQMHQFLSITQQNESISQIFPLYSSIKLHNKFIMKIY